jgi:hypothetical protein
VRETVGIPGTGISYTSVKSLHASDESASSSHVLPAPTPSATLLQDESGWVVAGRIAWKVLYWASIGIFVVAGTVLIALLAVMLSGDGKRRRRY